MRRTQIRFTIVIMVQSIATKLCPGNTDSLNTLIDCHDCTRYFNMLKLTLILLSLFFTSSTSFLLPQFNILTNSFVSPSPPLRSTTPPSGEILQSVRLSSPTISLPSILTFLRSIPFASLLPVQPLTYEVTDGGVEVKFRRKKTEDKSGIDGGMRWVAKEGEKEVCEIVCFR